MLNVRSPQFLKTSSLRSIHLSIFSKKDTVCGRIRKDNFKFSAKILAYPQAGYCDDFDESGRYYSKQRRAPIVGRLKERDSCIKNTRQRVFRYNPRIEWESNLAFVDQFDFIVEFDDGSE